MTHNPDDVRAARDSGFAALRAGEYRLARQQFERALDAGAADAVLWFGFSIAQRHLGAAQAETDALDKTLALDSAYLPALMRRADLYVQQGNERAACSYYGAAARLASNPKLPSEWQREAQRAAVVARQIAGRFESHLLKELAAHGATGAGTERFGRALDLLLGKRQVYLQEPKSFYFPELPQIEFYDTTAFPWTAALEAATPRIQAELTALLDVGDGFEPYIRRVADRPDFGNPLLENPAWSAGYLIRDGREFPANAARCPATLEALREVPLCRIPDRTPSVLFSLLRAGTRIRPHHGYTNARLICHLPLIVPGDCALRVGNETRPWRVGKMLTFDDSIEHEAWNLSQELRVVLLFDIWRPELTEQERSLVRATLEAVTRFDGARGWSD